jgi:hypothetical protein
MTCLQSGQDRPQGVMRSPQQAGFQGLSSEHPILGHHPFPALRLGRGEISSAWLVWPWFCLHRPLPTLKAPSPSHTPHSIETKCSSNFHRESMSNIVPALTHPSSSQDGEETGWEPHRIPWSPGQKALA